jgi:cytoskeletal protein RodZ
MAKEIKPTEARQGRRGWQVLVILICALILVGIVWWGVGIYGTAIEPDEPVGGEPAEQPEEMTPTQPAEPTEPEATPPG